MIKSSMITECWIPQSSHRDTFFSIYLVFLYDPEAFMDNIDSDLVMMNLMDISVIKIQHRIVGTIEEQKEICRERR